VYLVEDYERNQDDALLWLAEHSTLGPELDIELSRYANFEISAVIEEINAKQQRLDEYNRMMGLVEQHTAETRRQRRFQAARQAAEARRRSR
jgi:hypothetical protein